MSVATQLTASGRGVAGGALFTDGMSSALDPMFISDRAYRHGENVVHRGGCPRTRPGYLQRLALPEGNYQGATYFRPIGGEAQIVFAVAGKMYYSVYPFSSYHEIADVQLYEHAPQVFFATMNKSAQRNADGTVQAIEPVKVVVAQDGGFTRAAYWDGSSSGHSDPTVVTDDEDNVLTAGVPLGGPMCTSGDRLWVSAKNKLYASDIVDPLSFTETQYANEGGFFNFDEPISALAEVPSIENPVLLVFTKTKTYQILSGFTARDSWKGIPNFKATLFPDIGCAGQRGVIAQGGILWWMSATGLTNLNSAQQARVSSKLVPQDASMALSKANVFSDLTNVALGGYENFLLCSVPNGSRYNTHTWVYDRGVTPDGGESWAGIWTGTRPVDWVSGQFAGVPRAFHISYDYDGAYRLWEAFRPERIDNETPIQCFIESKTHIDFSQKATGLDLKQFLFSEVSFSDVQGTVNVSLYWAGTRGKYKKLGDYTLVATEGSLEAETVITASEDVTTYRAQQRRIRSPEINKSPAANTCTSRGVESKFDDWVDTGFSLLVVWTGRATLRSYRLFVDPFQEPETGEKAFVDAPPKVLEGVICP